MTSKQLLSYLDNRGACAAALFDINQIFAEARREGRKSMTFQDLWTSVDVGHKRWWVAKCGFAVSAEAAVTSCWCGACDDTGVNFERAFPRPPFPADLKRLIRADRKRRLAKESRRAA